MAALVDPAAAIDWWCWPRLDDDPVLWRLLDPAGSVARWRGAVPGHRGDRTVGPSLRTVVSVGGVELECLDAVLRDDGDPCIVRLVRARSHPCVVTHELRLHPFRAGSRAITAIDLGGQTTTDRDGQDTIIDAVPGVWRGVVLGGDVQVGWTVDDVLAEIDAGEASAARRTDPVSIITSHRDRAAVALGVLDACTDSATGAVVAAPTTSLPAVRGGDRQFDYRYAWLRDASLAASVAALVGENGMARRHLTWLRERCLACEGIPAPLTTVAGSPAPDEHEIDGVEGWAASRPVRIGNAAKDQVQLDGPGFVAEAVWITVAAGGHRDRAAYQVVASLADEVCAIPLGKPSAGIWELREPADVSSGDVGRWLLHDRAARLSWVHQPWAWRRRRRWRAAAREARDRFLGGRLPSGGAPLVYGRADLDGAGLLPVVLGLLPRRDPAAASLVDATIATLGTGDPVAALRRYPLDVDDGFEGDEGAFVPVSWWAVSALARLGRVDAAHELANRLCESLPGLQGEVIASDGEVLGNTPLVWSHAEAARALYLLRVADVRRRVGTAGVGVWRAWQVIRAQRRGRTSSSQKLKNPS